MAPRRWFHLSIPIGLLAALVGVLFFLQTRDAVTFVWIGYALWLIAAGWTYQDAQDRGVPGAPWAVAVLVGHVLGLALYLAVRGTGGPPDRDSQRP